MPWLHHLRSCKLALLTAAFLCTLPLHAADKPTPHPDLIFILIGQSNMAGRAPLLEADREPLASTWLLNNQGTWVPATNPLNIFSSHRKSVSMQRMGPGAGFVQRLHKELPSQSIGLIVNARGGSSIEQWNRDAPLYTKTLRRVRSLQDLEIDGILWHQGESNREDPKYLDKIERLIANLRADLKSPGLPFIAGQVFGTGQVNEHIQNLPRRVPRTGYVKSNGLTVFDKVHFDRSSQLLLGSRYADAYLRITRKPSPQD